MAWRYPLRHKDLQPPSLSPFPSIPTIKKPSVPSISIHIPFHSLPPILDNPDPPALSVSSSVPSVPIPTPPVPVVAPVAAVIEESREEEDMEIEESEEESLEERLRKFEEEEIRTSSRNILDSKRIVIIRLKKCILPPAIDYFEEVDNEGLEAGEIPQQRSVIVPPLVFERTRSRSRSPPQHRPTPTPITPDQRNTLQTAYLEDLDACRSASPPHFPAIPPSAFAVLKPKEDLFALSSDDDMFARTPILPSALDIAEPIDNSKIGLELDDSEGYYIPQVGEVLGDGSNRYIVQQVLGKGVYSCVVRVNDQSTSQHFAIKIIRRQEIMLQSGLIELRVLERLAELDPLGHKHTIKGLGSFRHQGHLCVVFEDMELNLREVLGKYGQGVGLSLAAVRSFAKQLMLALSLLKKAGYLHCDLKPDNILVSKDLRKIKLADFGSVLTCGEVIGTDVLVARYYRPPEVVLGATLDYAVDMWSAGCTLYELYTGTVLFPGASNGELLRLIMELKGPIPKRIRNKGSFSSRYFDTLSFAYAILDESTGENKLISIPLTELKQLKSISALIASKSESGLESELKSFASFLEETLHIDPALRLSPEAALEHPFLRQR